MTKDSVLAILRQEKDYISGEKISQAIGVSRAAVNAAVKSLRTEGYEILSMTNKGYLLTESPDRISIGELMPFLPEKRAERILCLNTVNSTNKYLRDLAYEGAPHGQVVLAREQTGGKGRFGSAFFSPKDQGIYLSYLFSCKETLTEAPLLKKSKKDPAAPEITRRYSALSAWIAVAVSDAIEQVCGIRPQIGWINDILFNGKKCGGILTELSIESETGQMQSIVIGIGLNITEKKKEFPKEIREQVSSLSSELKRPVNRAQLAAAVITSLDRLCADFPDKKGHYLSAYRTHCNTLNKTVTVLHSGKKQTAMATAVNDDFSLQVAYPDGSTEAVFTRK